MEIPAIGNYSIDIPDYPDFNIQPVNTTFETPNTGDDQIATNNLGPAAVVTVEAVAQQDILTQELQQNFLYNLDELRNGNISTNEFSSFLEENNLNLNVQESTIESLQNGTSNESSFAAALFSITQELTPNENQQNLSSYADYMDKVNEQTQSSDIRDKLSAYTSNLRN